VYSRVNVEDLVEMGVDVLTQLCLDSRFVHLPAGKLSSWKFSFL